MARSGADGKQPDQAASAAAAGRRRAAGIYGAIITASIMTTAGDSLSTVALALAVLITLLV